MRSGVKMETASAVITVLYRCQHSWDSFVSSSLVDLPWAGVISLIASHFARKEFVVVLKRSAPVPGLAETAGPGVRGRDSSLGRGFLYFPQNPSNMFFAV